MKWWPRSPTRLPSTPLVLLATTLVLACGPASPTGAPAGGAATGAPAAPASGAAADPARGEPITISIGFPVVAATFLHHFVGREQGFWEAEGLQIEPALTNGVPAIVQALVSGSYQLGSVSADTGITAVEKGADLVYVAGELRQAVFSVLAQPEVRSFADMRGGKVVGAASVRGGTSTLLRALFTQNGLKEGEDYTIVAAGSTTERMTGLRTRAIDAGLFAQPQDFQIRDEGYSLLGLTTDAIPDYAMSALAVRRDWARANEDMLVRALRAHVRALRWIHDPANKAAFVDTIVRHTRSEERYALRTYELLVEQLGTFPRDGALTLPAFEGTIKVLVDSGELPPPAPAPAKYLDTSYWEKAVASLGGR